MKRRQLVARCYLTSCPRLAPFSVINKPLKKKEISKLINASFRRCGLRATVVFADKLMQSGFRLATRAGFSFAADDMLVPRRKHGIIANAEAQVKEIQQQYASGLVTSGERYNKVVDIWGAAGDEIARAMMTQLGCKWSPTAKASRRQDSFNSIFMMADSGARGSAAQIRQLAGMRPDGETGRLDHRDADYRELPRRSQRSAVLHLDARRP